MFPSIATTHEPAIDLGFLLMKHPDRLREVELSRSGTGETQFGSATQLAVFSR